MGLIAIISYDRFTLLLLTVCGIMGQGECADSGRSGTSVCINVKQCKPIQDMLSNPKNRQSQSFIQHLRNIHCGFDGTDPKVWCEQQTDPPDVSKHVNLRMINSIICGPAGESKIHGGNKTGIFDYPWMALLAYRIVGSRDLEFRCGGTVINERYILTAAHCVVNPPGTLESVRVGEHNTATERDCTVNEDGEELACAEKYQDIDVESIHPHPEYLTENTANDIALVRLSRDIDLTANNVKPICLPVGSAAIPATKKMTVTGWGTTESGTQSDALLQINIPLVSNEDCALPYRKKTQISHKQLCAGGQSGIGSCTGDSGGPLQTRARYHNSAKFVQYGIVSFGLKDCATDIAPVVYTKVVSYMDWILNTIRP